MIGRTRRQDAARVYELCSLLLRYPGEALAAADPQIEAAASQLPRGEAREACERFLAWWAHTDPTERAQHYVETIDLGRSSGLYLTYYSDGDSRERGSSLVRLKQLYRAAGMPLEGTELPDYLPVMLEFAAGAPDGRGVIALREHRAAIELLRAKLREQDSPYAELVDAVCATLGRTTRTERALAGRMAVTEPPHELVGLDIGALPTMEPGR